MILAGAGVKDMERWSSSYMHLRVTTNICGTAEGLDPTATIPGFWLMGRGRDEYLDRFVNNTSKFSIKLKNFMVTCLPGSRRDGTC